MGVLSDSLILEVGFLFHCLHKYQAYIFLHAEVRELKYLKVSIRNVICVTSTVLHFIIKQFCLINVFLGICIPGQNLGSKSISKREALFSGAFVSQVKIFQ